MNIGREKLDIFDEIDDLDGTEYDPSDNDHDFEDGDVNDTSEPANEAREAHADTNKRDDSNQPDRKQRDLNQEEQNQQLKDPTQQKKAQQEELNKQAQNSGDLRRRPDGTAVNASGDIVDPRTGNVIAKHGTERRLWEKSNRLSAQLADYDARYKDLDKYVNSERTLAAEIKKNNFTPQEVQEYMNFAVAYKQNPLAALKEMVAHVASMGHNISEILGSDVGDAVDIKAINRLIEAKLAPLTDGYKATSEREQVEREYNTWLNNFIGEHEHSDVHLQEIDRVIGAYKDRGRNITAKDAYYHLRETAARMGLDFSRPLGPQIEEKRASAQTTKTDPQQRRAQQQPSFPRRSASAPSSRTIDEPEMASPNDSWDDIIRSSMKG